MVYKFLGNGRVINLWFESNCDAYLSIFGEGNTLQVENDSSAYKWNGDFLWRKMILVNGASIQESNISKKHLGIFYYAVKEASAAVICEIEFVKGTNNIANCLTMISFGKDNKKEATK